MRNLDSSIQPLVYMERKRKNVCFLIFVHTQIQTKVKSKLMLFSQEHICIV